jgi:hypothetical protein
MECVPLNSAFQKHDMSFYVFQVQNTVSGIGKEFHSVSESEAPDMKVHSLAGRAMKMEECCKYITMHPGMASIHLGGTRNQQAWTQENNAQLSWNSNASQRAQTQLPIILWAFLRLSSLYLQQQGPVLKVVCSVACQQSSTLHHRGQVHMRGKTFFIFVFKPPLNNRH